MSYVSHHKWSFYIYIYLEDCRSYDLRSFIHSFGIRVWAMTDKNVHLENAYEHFIRHLCRIRIADEVCAA